MELNIYMLFAGWEVRVVKNLWSRSWKCCLRPPAKGSIFKSEVKVFHYMKNNLFIFFQALKRKKLTEKNSRKCYCDCGQR